MDAEQSQRLFNRIDCKRDDLLCDQMDAVYGGLSLEELQFLWDRRDKLRLGPREHELLRGHVRKAMNIQPAPPPDPISNDGTVDWWSKPRDN